MRPLKAFLRAGANVLTVILENREPTFLRATIAVNWQPDLSSRRDLYLLAVGVSTYRDPKRNLNVAAKDAEAMVAAFAGAPEQPNPLFNLVLDPALNGAALTNARATKEQLLDRLNWLRQHAGRNGLALVTISGHAIKAENDRFFFCPYDYDGTKQPANTGVAWEDFLQYLKGLPCPVVVVLDTCHSGAIRVEGFRGIDDKHDLKKEIDASLSRLARTRSGLAVLAACADDEPAREKVAWGHGALTLALLEGLSGRYLFGETPRTRLPRPATGRVVTLEDLRRYAERRVEELVGSRQAVVTKCTEGMYPNRIPLAVRPSP